MLTLALSVAGCAAYFSIWGLSQLFAGASVAVIIMATILELAKIVTTTALHTYWDTLAKSLKIYLSISVGVLMLITSVGIYGFLSNAYQTTANKLEIHEGELGVVTAKKLVFENNLVGNNSIIENKTKRINQLSDLRSNQESRIDNTESSREKSRIRTDINNSNNEIQKLTTEIDELSGKNTILTDSINSYNIKALGVQSGSDIAGEVGPLKYIASLTGVPMANIVNYLILLLIFVFDPLAVALILATNKIFEIQAEPKVIEEEVAELIDPIEIEEEIHEEINVEIETPIKVKPKETMVEPTIVLVEEEPIKEIAEPIEVKKDIRKPIELEEIKEVKENRGYSVNVPLPKSSNTIERIGSNKIVKDGDNNKVFFKRK
jgi:hypothetical protein